MAIEDQIESVGYANGADDAFNYVADDHPLAEEAIDIVAPGAGESIQVAVEPGQLLRTDFDIAETQISINDGKVSITLENGAVIELVGPSADAFAAQPPILLQPANILALSVPQAEVEFTQDADEMALSVPKPLPGETQEYTIVPGQPLNLGFSLEDVEIIQTDNDISLLFADGSQITFVSLVDAAFSDSPPDLLQPDGTIIAATELIELASDISTYAETFGDIETAAGPAGPPSFAPVTNYGDVTQAPGATPINTTPVAPSAPAGSPADVPDPPAPGPIVTSAPPPPPAPPPVPPIPPPPAVDTLPTIAPLDAEVFEASFTLTTDVTVLDEFPAVDLGADLPTAQELGLPGSSDIDLDIDFGADGAALLQPVVFTADSVAALNSLNLTSHGSAITVEIDASGQTLTAQNADGEAVFTITINENEAGEFSYAFTLQNPVDHLDANSDDLSLPFTVQVTDGDGSVATGSFSVTVVDDTLGAVSEAEITLDVKDAGTDVLVAGSDAVGSGLLANEFADGVVGADGIRISEISFTGATGAQETAAVPADGSVDVETEFGTLTVSYDGTWSFTSLPIDGLPVSGSLNAGFGYTVTDNDGDTATAEQPISILTNDVPSIAFGESGAPVASGGGIVDEDDISSVASLGSDGSEAGNTLTQSIQVDFGADGAASTDSVVFSADTVSGLEALGLTSNGNAVSFALSEDGLSVDAQSSDGAPVFSMVIADDGAGNFSYTFTLTGNLDHDGGAGENLLSGIPFSIVATDADGDTATGSVAIDVRDDVPTAVDDVAVTLTEATGAISTDLGAANLLDNDELGADRSGIEIQSFGYTDADGETASAAVGETVITQFGQLTVNADGTWTYQVTDAANTLMNAVDDGFTYTIVDGDGDTSTATQSIQLDIPVNTDVSLTIAGDGLEDQPIPLSIDVAIGNPALFSLDSVVISDLPEGSLIFVDGVEQAITDGSITVSAADIGNVTFQAPEHSGVDQPISATAVLSNTVTGETLTAGAATDVVVRAVADGAELDVGLGSVVSTDTGADEEISGTDEADRLLGGGGSDVISGGAGDDTLFGDLFEGDVSISLDISADLIDQDGSESLYVMVAGFPETATLTNASGEAIELTNGAANLPWSQLGELTVTVPQTEADFTVVVSAQTVDVDSEQNFADTSETVFQSIVVSPASAASFGNDTLDGGAGEDQVFGEAGDDRGIFTVGEGGAGERYDGGVGDDTLVIRFTDADLQNPDILRELQEIQQFIADNADASTDSGAERTFEALGLTIQDWEHIELDGPDLPSITVAGGSVDEDDLATGSDVTPESTTLSQSIDVDFKVDGAAEADPLVFTVAGADALNSAGLTSNGSAVTFVRSEDGLTLSGTDANGTPIAEITITGDAENGFGYEFTLQGALDQAGDTLTLPFEIAATDAGGDTITASFDIDIVDDVPVAVVEAGVSIDATAETPVLTAGTDNAAEGLLANDTLGADSQSAQVATFSFTNALGETDTAVAGETVTTEFGQLTVNADGTWSYTAVNIPTDGSVSDDFSYSLMDSDGDLSTAVQPITITNDAAPEIVIGTPDDPTPGVTVDEDDLSTASDQGTDQSDSPSVGRQITIDFGEDGPADTDPVVFTDATVDGLNARGLTANGGQAISYTLSEDGRTISAESADGEDIFTMSIEGDAVTGFSYQFTLQGGLDHAEGDGENTISDLLFDVQVTDGDGTQASASITINIVDDVPVAVDDLAQTITEAGGVAGTDSGAANLLSNDDVGADGAQIVAFTYTDEQGATQTANAGQTVDTQFGQLTVNGDGTYSYQSTKAAANDLTAANDGFSYTVQDADGDQSTAVQPIVILDGPGPKIGFGGDPELDAGLGTVAESGLGSALNTVIETTTVDQAIDIDFGPDGPADDGAVVFSDATIEGLEQLALTADGEAVSFTLSDDGKTISAVDAGGSPVFEIGLSGEGAGPYSYSFSLQGNLDHPEGLGENDLSLPFEIAVTDGDGTQATAGIAINVVDDVPVAVDDPAQTITEAGGVAGTDAGAANLLSNDDLGADGGQIVAFTYTDADGATQLASAGQTVDTQFGQLTVNGDGTYSYQSTKAAANDLTAANDGFSYIVQDADGDQSTAVQPIVILDGPGPKISFGGDPNLTVASAVVDEDDIAGIADQGSDQSALASSTQSIEIDFGPDGPADGDPVVFTADSLDALTARGLSTNGGQPLSFAASEDGLTITASDPAGETVFDIALNGSATDGFSYTFTLSGNLDHDIADGENIISDIPFQIQVTDGDGTTATASINVDVVDDISQANDDQAVTINVDPTGTTTTSVDVAEFTHDVSNIVLYVRDSEGEITKVKVEAFPDGANGVRDIDSLDLEGFVSQNYPGTDLVALTVKAGSNATPGFGPGEGELTILDPSLSQSDLPVAAHVDGENTFTFQAAQAAGLGEGDGVLSFTEGASDPSAGIGLTVGSGSGGVNLLANDTLGADGEGAAITSFSFTNAEGETVTATAGETVATQFGNLTVNADGSWTYTTTSTPLDGAAADGFTYTMADGDGDISTASQPIQLGVSVDSTADVSIGGAGFEDERIDLTVEASLVNPSPALTITGVTVSNIPSDATLFAADGSVLDTSSGSITLTPDQLTGLQIQAAPDSGVDISGLVATAHVQNIVTGVVSDSTASGDVIVQAVADGAPVTASAEGSIGGDPGTDDVLTGGDGEDTIFGGGGDDQIAGHGADDVLYGDVFEGDGSVALTIDTGLVDLDGSETLIVTIDGFPVGASLTNTNGDDLTITDSAIQLSQAQLDGLTLTAPEGTDAFTLDVTVQTFDFDADDGTTDPSQVASTTLSIAPFGGATPGNDTIEGGMGDDTIFGNEGDDVLYGNGSEEVIEINHEWTVTEPLPPMSERRELAEEDVNGVDPANLTFAADHPVSVSFISEGAGYQNTLGYYKVGPNGEISDVQFVFENASDNVLNSGDSVELDIDAGDRINFFIVANGNSHNNYDAFSGGSYQFVDGDGNPATLTTDNPQLVYVGENGSVTPVNGPTYHSTGMDGDVGINPDGQQHSISGLNAETGGLQIAFEDLPALGDEDFNDLVIEVHAGPALTFGTDNDTIYGNDGDDIIFGNAGDDTVYGDDDDPGEAPATIETGTITSANVTDTDSGFTVGARQIDADGNLTDAVSSGLAISGNGIGVVGSPESGVASQLGYDPTEGVSEQLVVSFDSPVTSADFSFRNLYAGEGDNRGASGDEQGQWQVFNNGELVAEGLFTADGGNTGHVNIDTNGVTFDEIVFSATPFSGGQGDATGDSSDYYITEVNFARVVPGVSEGYDDTISGNDGNDVLFGMQGEDVIDGGADNDVIDGGSSDDIVAGGTGQDWIMGGTDTGSIQISESMDVTLVGSDAGYDNSFGYFIAGENGEPETGSVIWSNVNATEEGATHSIVLDGIDSGDVGFFIIPDGADQNISLTDGTAVTFTRNDDGDIVAVADGEALEGQGASAFFSGAAELNPDGLVHANESPVGGSQAALASATTDTVAEAILANDPVAFWRFGEGGGNSAVDATGNHDGLYKNGVDSSAEGAPGEDGNLGAGFDGKDDYVEVPHSADFQLATGTVMLAFNPADTKGTQGLFSRDAKNYEDGGHLTAELQGTKLVVRLQSDHKSYYVESDSDAIQAGDWHNVAFSFGEGGMNLYIDGALVDHNDYEGGIESNQEPIVIGAGSTTSREGEAGAREFFHGEIDDVAIFNTALDAVSLGAIYEPPPAPAEPDTPAVGSENGLLVELGFEDLAGGGDLDFNDLVVHVEHSVTVGAFEAGDQLWGGVEGGTGDGEKDVFFFREGDGVDTINDFEVGIDQLVISGYGRDDVRFFADGNDTIVRLGDNEAVKLVGVTIDDLGGDSAMADHDADGNSDGVLSADELIDLREDLFDEEGGSAPKAEDAGIVFVGPVETGLPDDNGGETPV